MDSSSEDSFAWTDTSSDSIESQNMGFDEEIENVEEKTESGTKSERKRKLKQSLNNVSQIEKEQSSDDSHRFKQKKVKIEPESENEVPKKKKKKKKLKVEKSEIDEEDSVPYDESYLNLKVKQENIVSSPLETKTKKKYKLINVDCNYSTLETFDNYSNYSETPEVNGSTPLESDTSVSRKKKKKTKRESHKGHQDDEEINDKMNVEDLTLDLSHINNNSDIKLDMKSTADSSVAESYTSQNETNYSEISAIQGDENHNLHSLTPNNCKSVTNKKKNENLHKSTVLSQFKDKGSQSIEKRMSRISDRLMFEDDEETESHTNGDNQMSTKLKKCLKDNNDFQKVSQKMNPNVVFSNDDEIWLVKCPQEIDVEAFLGTEFNTDAKCKIKVCGQTYDGSLEGEQPYSKTVLHMTQNNFVIKSIPLFGIINFRKRIPKAHFHYDNVMMNNQTNFIPLPEMKCRHPLFGSNYKKAIKIPAPTSAKLNLENNDERTIIVQKEKKKKHRKSRITEDEVDEASVTIDVNFTKCEPVTSLETVGNKRKKRKHTHDESPAPKKVKRIKYEPECAEAWESEKAIEKTLFDF